MSDAYMALALNNAQGELHPLEVGMHALKSGLTIRDYAKVAGVSATAHAYQRQAAEVFTYVNADQSVSSQFRHLSAIHAAPRWPWWALVARLVALDWSVDVTRKAVKAVADAPEFLHLDNNPADTEDSHD